VASEEHRASERVSASMRIKLKYPDLDTFIQKYAANISRGGIFIATKSPKAVGTHIRFEFLLADSNGTSVIRGEGQVQWIREYDPATPAKAHGMGLKFTLLDADSQAIIDRALAWRAQQSERRSDSAEIATTTPVTGPDTAPIALAEPSAPAEKPPVSEAAPTVRAPEAAAPKPAKAKSRPKTPVVEAPAAKPGTSEADLEALASSWGISNERLAKTLRAPRAHVGNLEAELDALAHGDVQPPSKAEALAQLGALVERRASTR
jgi:uncharacterized protein (TIGR02266 family)